MSLICTYMCFVFSVYFPSSSVVLLWQALVYNSKRCHLLDLPKSVCLNSFIIRLLCSWLLCSQCDHNHKPFHCHLLFCHCHCRKLCCLRYQCEGAMYCHCCCHRHLLSLELSVFVISLSCSV